MLLVEKVRPIRFSSIRQLSNSPMAGAIRQPIEPERAISVTRSCWLIIFRIEKLAARHSDSGRRRSISKSTSGCSRLCSRAPALRKRQRDANKCTALDRSTLVRRKQVAASIVRPALRGQSQDALLTFNQLPQTPVLNQLHDELRSLAFDPGKRQIKCMKLISIKWQVNSLPLQIQELSSSWHMNIRGEFVSVCSPTDKKMFFN
jgi:hypothetical protein